MVSNRLDFDFHPDKAYKLCDLRPFYGYIHHDILINYDFWGYGDVDLVWGNLRNFYTDYILNNYDALSTHADRMSGHLTLIRNIPKYNNLAFKIPQWEKLIADSHNHAVDEQHFTLQLYPHAKWMWKIHKYVFFRFKFKDEWRAYNKFCRFFNAMFKPHKLYFKEQYTTPWFTAKEANDSSIINNYLWLYEKGKVLDLQNNIELPYLHFLSLKHYWKEYRFGKVDPSKSISFSLLGIHAYCFQ